jgi:photosystem II stability/assembly factor-like uncharacterized protein
MFAFTASAQWIRQSVETTASLRGLAVVNEKVIWASGTGGTVIRTIDSGKTWDVLTVPGAEKLDFRDIEAFDANTAYILSIGNGDASRIYKTTDGGKTWQLQFTNTDEKAFYDAMACSAERVCLAMSDPVDGRFRLLRGEMFYVSGPQEPLWDVWIPERMPAALDGEAAFAASGTCLIVKDNFIWLVTGGSNARVLRSSNDGFSWTSAETPMPKGTSGSGIFSIAMWDARSGVIVGGNYEKPDEAINNLAFTTDGGITWRSGRGLTGYRSGVAYIDKRTIIAVGTNGTDISRDGGKTWKKSGDENLNTVAEKGKTAVWAVGPNGMVAKFK